MHEGLQLFGSSYLSWFAKDFLDKKVREIENEEEFMKSLDEVLGLT